MLATHPQGADLRAERVRRRLRAADVALVAGLSRQRISQIEAAARPTDRDVARYLRALSRVDVNASPDELAALAALSASEKSEEDIDVGS